jgi:hypothetical protein
MEGKMGKKFIALCNCLNKNPHNFVILHKTDAIEDVCIYCSHYVQWVDAKILNGERIMLRGNGNKEKPYCSNNKKKEILKWVLILQITQCITLTSTRGSTMMATMLLILINFT